MFLRWKIELFGCLPIFNGLVMTTKGEHIRRVVEEVRVITAKGLLFLQGALVKPFCVHRCRLHGRLSSHDSSNEGSICFGNRKYSHEGEEDVRIVHACVYLGKTWKCWQKSGAVKPSLQVRHEKDWFSWTWWGIACYISSENIWLDFLESEGIVENSRAWDAIDVWLGRPAAVLKLYNGCADQLCFLQAIDHFPLAGHSVLPQIWSQWPRAHNARKLQFLCSAIRAEAVSLWLYRGDKRFVHYSKMQKEKLEGFIKIMEVEIFANSVFVVHSHLQHPGAWWIVRKRFNITPKSYRNGLEWRMQCGFVRGCPGSNWQLTAKPGRQDEMNLDIFLSQYGDKLCLGWMKVRHVEISVMVRSRTVLTAVATVTPGIQRYEIAMW